MSHDTLHVEFAFSLFNFTIQNMRMADIDVKNLTRRFGSITAVDDVSFHVSSGEVLGFLGPNGAGKTTTMRMITGYLTPNKGAISVAGIDVLKNPEAAKMKIGYLPENAPVYRDMDVKSFLSFVATVRGMRGKQASDAIDRAIEVSRLESVVYQNIDTLSKGYLRRTCFAQSIIHDPPVLILDEPTDGLDPNQKHDVREMIREMGRDKAIIISTHILEEVEACCSRALIISSGRLVANGTPENLKKHSLNAGTVIISIKSAGNHKEALESLSSVSECIPEGGENSFRLVPPAGKKAAETAMDTAELARKNRWELESLATDPGQLDDVFRRITLKGEKIEEPAQ